MDILDRHRNTAKYWIVGKEIGAQGTPHLQGYCYFDNAKKWDQIVKWFDNPRVHLEVAKGNKSQNFKYCSKDGDFETNINEVAEVSEEVYMRKLFSEAPALEKEKIKLIVKHAHLDHVIGSHYGDCEICSEYEELN